MRWEISLTICFLNVILKKILERILLLLSTVKLGYIEHSVITNIFLVPNDHLTT